MGKIAKSEILEITESEISESQTDLRTTKSILEIRKWNLLDPTPEQEQILVRYKIDGGVSQRLKT